MKFKNGFRGCVAADQLPKRDRPSPLEQAHLAGSDTYQVPACFSDAAISCRIIMVKQNVNFAKKPTVAYPDHCALGRCFPAAKQELNIY